MPELRHHQWLQLKALSPRLSGESRVGSRIVKTSRTPERRDETSSTGLRDVFFLTRWSKNGRALVGCDSILAETPFISLIVVMERLPGPGR